MRILIVSDLHANWPALCAVCGAVPNADAVICLGDLVNYGPHPAECVNWARSHATWIVQGNHDHAFGFDLDPRCSGPYRSVAAAMSRATSGRLSTPQKRFLAGLPETIATMIDGATCFMCHAVPSDPRYGYCPPDVGLERWAVEAERVGKPDFLLVGHTHLPFILRTGQTIIVNPGSVGQPKDGDPRASYALWHDGQVALRKVAYDTEATVRDLVVCVGGDTAGLLSGVLRTGGSLPAPAP